MLLGLDVGTTNCKAVLYEPGRGPVALAKRPTITHYDEKGWATYDPAEMWATVAACIREVLAEAAAASGGGAPPRVDGVAASSMAESGVTLDDHGRYVYPVIAWFDPRSLPEAQWWDTALPPERLASITGLRSHAMYSATKLLWMKRHEPEAFGRIHRFLCMGDFVIYKLTGEVATDVSLASRTMLFDIGRRAWAGDLASLAGLSTSIFPTALECGTVVGRVTDAAAAETGLARGTPVVTGGHDHICASLAAGVVGEGDLLDSAGTGQSMLAVCPRRPDAADLVSNGVSCGCHLTPGGYYVIGGAPACGVALAWAIEVLGLVGAGPGDYGLRLSQLVTLAADSEPGAGGAVFLPTLRGGGPPARDSKGRGALLGLTGATTRADLARAVLEGLAGQAGRLKGLIQRAARLKATRVVAVGGVNDNDFILQLKADVMGIAVEKCRVPEAAAMGAAMLAGIGCGVYRDARDASARVQADYVAAAGSSPAGFAPSPETTGFYATWLDAVFTPLDDDLRRFNHAVAALPRVEAASREGGQSA